VLIAISLTLFLLISSTARLKANNCSANDVSGAWRNSSDTGHARASLTSVLYLLMSSLSI